MGILDNIFGGNNTPAQPCGYVEINTSVDLYGNTEVVPLTIENTNTGEIIWKGRMDRPVNFPVYHQFTDILLKFGSRFDWDFSDTVEAGKSYQLVIYLHSEKTGLFKEKHYWVKYLKIADSYDDYEYDSSDDDDDYDYGYNSSEVDEDNDYYNY